MAFRCQVHHQIWVGLLHCSLNGCCIGQIHFLQPVPIVRRAPQLAQYLLNRGQVAGIPILSRLKTVTVVSRNSLRTTAPPMKPAPPVTRTLRRSPSRSEAEGMDETIGVSVDWGLFGAGVLNSVAVHGVLACCNTVLRACCQCSPLSSRAARVAVQSRRE